MTYRWSVLALAAGLAAALPQGTKAKGPQPGQGVDWKADWEASLREASARNIPLLFYVGQDG